MIPDEQTLGFYDKQANILLSRYEGAKLGLWDVVAQVLPEGSKILDVGFGSGRDLASLHKKGFDCWGVDPSAGMVAAAKLAHPEIEHRLFQSAIPIENPEIAQQRFSLISFIAVLMHFKNEELLLLLNHIKKMLEPNGLVTISCSLNRQGLDYHYREVSGRVFYERSPEDYRLVFEDCGFNLVHETRNIEDFLGRDMNWFSQIYLCRQK